MYCPSCGKQIADESVFCMFCGKSIPGKAPDADTPALSRQKRETPPIHIDNVHLWLRGSTERQKRKLTQAFDTIGRGLEVAFCLVDANNQQTAVDGELIWVLRKPGNWDKHFEASEKGISQAMKGAVLYDRRTVTKQEFGWIELSNEYGKQWVELSYCHTYPGPFWFEEFTRLDIYLWFKTPDRRYLYNDKGWVKWYS